MEFRDLEDLKPFVNLLSRARYEFIWRDLVKEFRISFTEPLTSLEGAFRDTQFDTIDLRGLDTSKVETMSELFANCNRLQTLYLSDMNTENATDMSSMFTGCKYLKYLYLSDMNTENVTDMSSMFNGCNRLKRLDLSHFNTENVYYMSYMFSGCQSLEELNLSYFNTENVRDMSGMFSSCKSLEELNLTHFNTENVRDMSDIFLNCNAKIFISGKSIKLEEFKGNCSIVMKYKKFEEGNIEITDLEDLKEFVEKIDSERDKFIWSDLVNEFELVITKPLEYLGDLFRDTNFKEIDLRGLDVCNVRSMLRMFTDCKNLKKVNLRGLNTSNVREMAYMFSHCENLEELDLSDLDTRNLEDMALMFSNCENLGELDLSDFDTRNVNSTIGTFGRCDIDITICDKGLKLKELESDKVRVFLKEGENKGISDKQEDTKMNDPFSSSSLF